MQVFVPFSSPFVVASVLDKKRLNKQIIECRQILDAMQPGSTSHWKNHPVVLMYKDHELWLRNYMHTLEAYREGALMACLHYSEEASKSIPLFLQITDICEQHRRRLYTKDPVYYDRWNGLGTSEENWYFLEGRIVKYVKGKRV